MKAFWKTVLSRLTAGENVFLAIVVRHSPHSPGTTGARLAMSESGDVVGTIGGGIMEYNLLAEARVALSAGDFVPELRRLVHQETSNSERSGLICAGEQTNLCYLCRPEVDGNAIEQAALLQEQNRPGLLTISPHGIHCEASDPAPGLPQTVVEHSGDNWQYFEQLLDLKRLAILGGGHCGLALARVMHFLGYYISVFDTRPALTTMGDNMPADRKEILLDFVEAAVQIDYPELTDVVVMTTNVDSDARALLGTIGHPFHFVGVMGSKAKIATIHKALRSKGVTKSQMQGITAPVGLEIGSKTPEQIAISVAAQLVAKRSG